MIDLKTIKNLAVKWQTTEFNVLREYCQHCFLNNLYQNKKAEKILFKGGTALRIVYNSPRFSEDLDFSSSLDHLQIESLLEQTFYQIESTNLEINIEEAKITSGGYLASLLFTLANYKIKVLLEISVREKRLKGRTILINCEFFPPYTLETLEEKDLIGEKIQALLERKKPRDYFDLYFILRSNLLTISEKKIIKDNHQKIISTKINFQQELKVLLPKNYQKIIKNFPQSLNQEIKRQIG